MVQNAISDYASGLELLQTGSMGVCGKRTHLTMTDNKNMLSLETIGNVLHITEC